MTIYSLIQIALIILLIRQIVIFLIAFWTYQTSDAPFKSLEKSIIRKILLEADLSPKSTIYDLGSGSGKVVFTLARNLPNKIVGVEKNLLLHWYAQLHKIFSKQKPKITFLRQDMLSADLSKADFIIMYLSDKANKLLQPRLEEVLRPGTVLVVIRFKFASNKFRLVKELSAKYPIQFWQKR